MLGDISNRQRNARKTMSWRYLLQWYKDKSYVSISCPLSIQLTSGVNFTTGISQNIVIVIRLSLMYIGIWDFAGKVFYLYRGFIFCLVGKKLLIHMARIAFILSRSLLTLVKSSGLQTDPGDSEPLCKLMPAIEGVHRKNKLQSKLHRVFLGI